MSLDAININDEVLRNCGQCDLVIALERPNLLIKIVSSR